MRFSRSLAFVLVFAAGASAGLVACGSSSKSNNVDAKILTNTDAPVSTIDAFVPAPDAAPTPVGCDYAEQMDTNNDDTFGDATGMPESTNLSLAATALTLCGDINAGHFDAADMVVDYDAYGVTVATEQDTLLEFSAPGAAALDAVNVQLYDSNGDFVIEADFLGDHGAASVHLLADTYEVDVAAFNSVATTTTSHYKLKIIPDVFNTRCPAGSTPAYTESADGASGTGNDMIDISFDSNGNTVPVLTTATTDAAEVTGITVGSGSNYLIDGTSAMVTPRATENYLDEDTYSFTTGAMTNQVAIRADWVTAGSDDYDWFLFEPNTATIIASSDVGDTTGPEAETIAVLPSTTYWLWVAPYMGSTVNESYGLTICGENYAAP